MSKNFMVFLIGSISSILFSSVAYAQSPEQFPQQIPNQVPAGVSSPMPNIEGKWKISISGENRSTTCTLIQKGNVLTGTFRGQMGDLPLTGSVTNDRKMAFTARFGGMSLKFAGTVDGKTIKGIVDLPMGRGRKNFTGSKEGVAVKVPATNLKAYLLH
jgi:hypothetical protein